MSGKLVGEVYEKEVSGMAQRVLLAMADHAHDDGSHCFPSIPRLAWKLGCATRTIIRAIQDLEEGGVLVVDRQTGRANEYRIVLAALADKQPFIGTHGRPKKPVTSTTDATKTSDISDRKPVTFEAKTSDIYDKTSDIAMSPEPINHQLEPSTVNRQAASASRRAPKKPFPDDFKVTDAMYEWAFSKGVLAAAADYETERFEAYWRSQDGRFSDWGHAWRNWMLKVAQDQKQGRVPYRAASGTLRSRAENPDRRLMTPDQLLADE